MKRGFDFKRLRQDIRRLACSFFLAALFTISLPAIGSCPVSLALSLPYNDNNPIQGQPLTIGAKLRWADVSFDKIELVWWHSVSDTLTACKASGNCLHGRTVFLPADATPTEDDDVLYFEKEIPYFASAPLGVWRMQATLVEGDLAMLSSNTLIFKIVPGSLQQIPADTGMVEMHGPDLQVTDFEVEVLPAGQPDLNGHTYPTKRYYFVWTVRNMGDEIAAASKLRVTFEMLSEDPIDTTGLNYWADIKQLWPKPNQISGAQKAWNQPPFAPPPSSVFFLFRAEIDPANEVTEKNEANNVLIIDNFELSSLTLTAPPHVPIKEFTLQQETQNLKTLRPLTVLYPKQGQVFFAPARIKPRVLGANKVRYILKKQVKGRWLTLKPVDKAWLAIKAPGRYCLAAAPEGQDPAPGKCIVFDVKAKKTHLKTKHPPRSPSPAGTGAPSNTPDGKGGSKVPPDTLYRPAD
jgi:hypothetical protein